MCDDAPFVAQPSHNPLLTQSPADPLPFTTPLALASSIVDCQNLGQPQHQLEDRAHFRFQFSFAFCPRSAVWISTVVDMVRGVMSMCISNESRPTFWIGWIIVCFQIATHQSSVYGSYNTCLTWIRMTSIEFEILGCVKREVNLTYAKSSLHEELRVLLGYSENRHEERYAHKAHIIHMIFKPFIPPPLKHQPKHSLLVLCFSWSAHWRMVFPKVELRLITHLH